MKKRLSIITVIVLVFALALFSLTSANAKQKNVVDSAQKATDVNIIKFDSNEIDVSNVKYQPSETQRNLKLEKAITNALEYNKATDGIIKYYYNYIDLNNDQHPEIFVYLIGSYVSGSGGSTALIFEDNNAEYKLLSQFSLVHNPIIISDDQTNGWKDLIMYVSGGGITPFYSHIKFDGNRYPENPSIQQPVQAGKVVNGVAIIADDLQQVPGIELQ